MSDLEVGRIEHPGAGMDHNRRSHAKEYGRFQIGFAAPASEESSATVMPRITISGHPEGAAAEQPAPVRQADSNENPQH